MVERLKQAAGLIFLTVAIVIHLNFIISLVSGSLNFLFYDTWYLVGQAPDFFSYYQAGHNVLNGLDPYVIPIDLSVPYLYPFRYLPYFSYTFGAAINLTDPFTAYWIWDGILIVAIWLSALQTRRVAKALGRSPWEVYIGMGMWFFFTPIYIELYVGQVTLIAGILVFFALTTPSLVNGGRTRGSLTAPWTLGALAKTIPYFITPVFLAAGRVRTVLIAAIVSIIAIFAVPAGYDSLQYFLAFNNARNNWITPYPGDHSLKMLIYYVFGEFSRDFSSITVMLIIFFIGLALFITLFSRDVWASAGMLVLSYYFVMLDVWEHHYTFLLPFLVLAFIRGSSKNRGRWIPLVLALVMSIPIIPTIRMLSGIDPSIHPIYWDIGWQIVLHSSKVVPALVFYFWLMIIAVRSPRADTIVVSMRSIFQDAWNGLTSGNSPNAVGGILLTKDSDMNESQSQSHQI